MSQHQRFHYRSERELLAERDRLGLEIPYQRDLSALGRPLSIGRGQAPNRIAIHPMEGCDGTAQGAPGELTLRRYRRFAAGGAGLIWFEATAVVQEGRANPRQLYLTRDTLDDFKRMLEDTLATAQREQGIRPYTVLQLTHSGRYSNPGGGLGPVIAAPNPYLDTPKVRERGRIISDEELERLEDAFAEAAYLAAEAGFDAVDIKACHRYLNNELLSAFTRPGRYGGSYENRTRFMRNAVDKVLSRAGDRVDVASRFNAYDAIAYPYGWGVSRQDPHRPDLTEPKRLLRELSELGVALADVSCGNPYYNPHIGRPYDRGPYVPPEHPLEGTARMLSVMRQMAQAAPDMAVIGTGLTWLRQYGAPVAAACVERGWFAMAGFGRQGFAYPDFPSDILHEGGMDPKKVCVGCTDCSCIMRDGGRAGCVIRDGAVYLPIYQAGREGKPPFHTQRVDEHV